MPLGTGCVKVNIVRVERLSVCCVVFWQCVETMASVCPVTVSALGWW